MNKKIIQNPMVSNLLYGSYLGTIAHSFFIMSNPILSHEQSWDGINYSVQDSMGARGTVTFAGDQVVGVFFDNNSPRNPFRSGEDIQLLLQRIFSGISEDLWTIAKNEALQYVLQEYGGQVFPIITAAFWSEGEYLTAGEPWNLVINHGAHLIRNQFSDIETAIMEWQEYYELAPAHIDLIRLLFNRKMTTPDQPILLSKQELAIIKRNGDEGLDDSRELLAAIGIIIPY